MKKQTLDAQLVGEIAHLIAHKVHNVLKYAPEYPYQKTFANPYYRSLLLICVTRQIYGHYRINRDESPTPLKMFLFCLAEQAAISSLVQESAVLILEDEQTWMSCASGLEI